MFINLLKQNNTTGYIRTPVSRDRQSEEAEDITAVCCRKKPTVWTDEKYEQMEGQSSGMIDGRNCTRKVGKIIFLRIQSHEIFKFWCFPPTLHSRP